MESLCIISIVISGLAFLIAAIALGLACYALTYFIGTLKSTHQVQYVDPMASTGDELKEEISQTIYGKKPKKDTDGMPIPGMMDLD